MCRGAVKRFDKLLTDGPAYGYFSEPSKTVLVIQSSDVERASDLFCDLGVHDFLEDL